MNNIRYWLLGFRAGWWSEDTLPGAAWTAHSRNFVSYYLGFQTAQNIRHNLTRRP